MQSSIFNGAHASYYVHPQSQTLLKSAPLDPHQLKPVLVISSDSGQFDVDAVVSAVQRFTETDDVFSADFLSDCLIVQTLSGIEPQRLNAIFDPLLHLHSGGIWKNVAVPSRLYFKSSLEKPLAGKRVSVKDCYRLMGVKTTMSSRPFEETYGPDNETAAFVRELIGLDFHAPFNPRGDGYQTPAGSSNGAAAALAGYPWLDYSIGTDTSGSIRELDAIGILGRDLQATHRFVKATVKAGPGDINEFPSQIIYPADFLPYGDSKMQAIVDEFVKNLECYLGVERSVISIAERWLQCPPIQANGRPIPKFLEKVGYYPFYYDGYHEYARFRQDYRNKFEKEPYVGPYMQWKWEIGSKVSAEQKEGAIEDISVYRKWFSECIMREDTKTASDAILIMPLDTPAPDYRDTIHKQPGPVTAFSESYTASLLGLPQLVVTIGQVPYESRATKRIEYHPVTISLVGARGSDLMLINLARETLKHANWSDQLLTGRYTFKVGEGTRNVAEDGAPKL
ncbi:uncharacterized protein N7483_007567 [Penicillium malachiteum]|uniref:uncharacterized protein n=1 Tax=Penicillium malachiteum TaxID=1324776 RepID=UPI0025491416|nr:uncharacterized protein N7483_007567 [Penicillium malachiteum]KAJ5726210.1 hypothetical protein N7483_007567 [Penicillium malachiteum]